MRIEVVFESDTKILQIKMTSVNCLIYCFDAITGQVLQIESLPSFLKYADTDISIEISKSQKKAKATKFISLKTQIRGAIRNAPKSM